MSPFKNTACASCHMPYVAFSGPIPSVNLQMIAYPGSFRYRAAKRTAQRYVYSHSFPDLNFNTTQGAFFGGNTVFRVRVLSLEPHTTYYYKVDSAEPNGSSDGHQSSKNIHDAVDPWPVPACAIEWCSQRGLVCS